MKKRWQNQSVNPHQHLLRHYSAWGYTGISTAVSLTYAVHNTKLLQN
jgi:hypothetical protein